MSALLRLEASDAPKLPAKESFHLYLLIGQSNMAGRGKVEPQDKVPHPRVLMLDKENAWVPALDPLHFDKPTIAGVGLGSSFGRAMAEAAPGVTIGLIPCAVGGTPLARWQKGGDLYEQALVRAKVALKAGTLKGILWHQGESDSKSEDTANSYAQRLAQAVKDWRSDLGVNTAPFVAGKLGLFLAEKSKDGQPSTLWRTINAQIESLPKLIPYCAVADSDGLQHKGDSVHFDSASLREFGKRYAEQMKSLQKK
ncbi:MAG: sialate O-acetylesterase [Verrucomicrobiota bacterium]